MNEWLNEWCDTHTKPHRASRARSYSTWVVRKNALLSKSKTACRTSKPVSFSTTSSTSSKLCPALSNFSSQRLLTFQKISALHTLERPAKVPKVPKFPTSTGHILKTSLKIRRSNSDWQWKIQLKNRAFDGPSTGPLADLQGRQRWSTKCRINILFAYLSPPGKS